MIVSYKGGSSTIYDVDSPAGAKAFAKLTNYMNAKCRQIPYNLELTANAATI